MATIITQILRRTPMLYRSRVAISNYRRSRQIESNTLSRVSFSTFYNQNTKELDDHTGQASSTQTISQTKLPENLISDDSLPLTATLCNLLHHLHIEEAIDVIKSHKTKVDGDQLLCSLITALKKFDERSPFDAFVELVCRIRDRSERNDLIGEILIETVAINEHRITPPGADYEELISVRLVGLMLVICVRQELRKNIVRYSTETVGTGALNFMGNKGGVGVSLQLNEAFICFVNSHLAAHTHEVDRRKEDHDEIPLLR